MGKRVHILDMFSGCGAMTLGALEAVRALGFRRGKLIACDKDERALAVYRANFRRARTISRPLEGLFRGPGEAVSPAELSLRRVLGRCHLLIGGPPCQGHSDLNNHTRRADPRNQLMLLMLRAAEVLKPAHVLIENVRGIQHDRGRVVDKVALGLKRLGYSLDHGVVRLEEIGVPQTRHRFVLAASREKSVRLRSGRLRGLQRENVEASR